MSRPPSASQRIAAELREQITNGTLGSGALLPSEPELASGRNVSRQTARAALQLLEQEGLVTVRARRGRIVRSHQRLRWNLSSFESPDNTATSGADAWETDVERQGHDPTRQDLTVERIPPPPEIADLLDLNPAEDTCVVRRRVRYIDGEHAIISDDYFDLRIVEGTELAEPEDTTREGVHSRGRLSWADARWLISGGVSVCRFGSWLGDRGSSAVCPHPSRRRRPMRSWRRWWWT